MIRAIGRGAVLALVSVACTRVPARPRPNVVVVLIDTLRRDHVGAYGYGRPTTPRIDELARRGVALDGIAPASWTKPSTASLMTGLHPLRHRAIGRVDALSPAAVTLAERLRDLGFHTGAVAANNAVSPEFGFDRGFDRFQSLWMVGEKPAPADEAFARFETETRGLREPFFAYLHLMDPHAPYTPAHTFDGAPRPPGSPGIMLAELDGTRFAKRPAAFLRQAVDLYDGEIRDADTAVGAVLDLLRQRGQLEHTLVVVAADHGEEFEEHGRMGHGQALYRESVEVPLVLAGPGIRARGHIGSRVSLMDVVPTVLGLLGRRVEPTLDGIDLSAWLTGSEEHLPGLDRSFLLHLDMEGGMGVSLLRPDYKMVLSRRPYRKELFALAADSQEQHSLWDAPLAAAVEPVARDLAGQLANAYNAAERAAGPSLARVPSERLSAQLAALGYVGAASPRPGLPGRVRAPDLLPGGTLGWEPPGQRRCVVMSSDDDEPFLLKGWYGPEAAGRWSAASASLVLTADSAGMAAVRLTGTSVRPDVPRLRVAADGVGIIDAGVPSGTFRMTSSSFRVSPGASHVMTIEVTPAFVPAASGAAQDRRELGLFFDRICLAPAE